MKTGKPLFLPRTSDRCSLTPNSGNLPEDVAGELTPKTNETNNKMCSMFFLLCLSDCTGHPAFFLFRSGP